MMKKQASNFLKLTIALTVTLLATLTYAMPAYDDVLVIINDDSPTSVEVGNYFIAQRKIKPLNVCHISTPDKQASNDTSQMTEIEEERVIQVIQDYLTNNNLEDKINYIVLTRGIPFWSKNDHSLYSQRHLFDIELLNKLSLGQLKYNSPAVAYGLNKHNMVTNPYFYHINDNYLNLVDYKFRKNKYGFYIVCRLDGPGVVGARKLIDNSGYEAYHAYDKNNIKFLRNANFLSSNDKKNELARRTNIQEVYPKILGSGGGGLGMMREMAKEISFCYFDWVNAGTSEESVYSYSLYRGIELLPGGIIGVFRSHPAYYMNRPTGSAVEIDLANGTVNSLRKQHYNSGADMRFRHMTAMAYDPINDWIWCGTGNSVYDYQYSYSEGLDRWMDNKIFAKQRGGGIGILDGATGDVLAHYSPHSTVHYSPDTSGLTGARVSNLQYDKHDKLMWVGHWQGIQYYDLRNKTWHSIPELTYNFTSAPTIYVDPFDTDKVYFAFYYVASGDKSTIASQVPDAASHIFEYSKSAKTVKKYKIKTSSGYLPLITKTSADIAWVTWGKSLFKYKLSEAKILQTIDLTAALAAEKTIDEDDYEYPILPLLYPRALTSTTNSSNENIVCIAYGTRATSSSYKGKDYATSNRTYQHQTNYVLRIKETGDATSTQIVAKHPAWRFSVSREQWIQSLVVDPNDSDKMYIAMGSRRAGKSILAESTDSGQTWAPVTTSTISYIFGMTVGKNNKLYTGSGAFVSQQLVSDFILDGATAVSGGMVHDMMYYTEGDSTNYVEPPYLRNGLYKAGISPVSSQVEATMFMMLDGYSIADSRFAIFKNYPHAGGAGHTGHMLTMPPKCTPFAPRVDEDNTVFNVVNNKTIEIMLDSPGLIASMDGFIPSTINKNTISLTDKDKVAVDPATYTIALDADGITVVITGLFESSKYFITFKCGNDGIKNIKGAPMVNTRKDEFKDEITHEFAGTPDIIKPPTPTGLTQVANVRSIDFNWDDTPDASGIEKYEIMVSELSDFSTVLFSGSPTVSNITGNVWAFEKTNYWKVRAIDTAKNISDWSEVKSFMGPRDANPPSVPDGLKQALSDGYINFDWNDSTDESAIKDYIFRVSASSDMSNIIFSGAPVASTLMVTVSKFSQGNIYWQVQARDIRYNTSAWSKAKSFTVPRDEVKPTVPDGLAHLVSPHKIEFDWNDSTDSFGIANYELLVSDDRSFATVLFRVSPTTSDSSTVVWTFGKTNYWKVRAKDSSGLYSMWSEVKDFAGPAELTPPSTPTGLTNVMKAGQLNLNWHDSTDASGIKNYEVILSDSNNFAKVLFNGSPIASNVATKNWSEGVANYWKVRAVDTVGNVSAWSKVNTFSVELIKPSIPTKLIEQVTASNIKFFWSASTDNDGIASYNVEFANDQKVLWQVTAPADKPEVSISTFGETPYTRWRVRSMDHAGNFSSWTAWNIINSTTDNGNGNSGSYIALKNNFYGNATSDILLRNQLDGTISVWESGLPQNLQLLGSANANWTIVGTGDFNGNNRSDILWQHKLNGTIGIWEGGTTWQLLGTVPPADWEVVGVGYFNDNNKSDILWQHKTNGTIGLWEDGNAANWVHLGRVSRTDWEVVGIGDFNGNNKSDILWQHKTNGTIGIWEDGDTANWVHLGRVSRTDWEVVNIGDFNGNNKSDILWQHKATGTTGMWEAGIATNWSTFGTVPRADWEMVGVADFNGNNKSDILWQNRHDGTIGMWEAGVAANWTMFGSADRNIWSVKK